MTENDRFGRTMNEFYETMIECLSVTQRIAADGFVPAINAATVAAINAATAEVAGANRAATARPATSAASGRVSAGTAAADDVPTGSYAATSAASRRVSEASNGCEGGPRSFAAGRQFK